MAGLGLVAGPAADGGRVRNPAALRAVAGPGPAAGFGQRAFASSRPRNPASSRAGLGGQPAIVRSTGTLPPTPPNTA